MSPMIMFAIFAGAAALFLLPFFHAARSGNGLAVISTTALLIIAAVAAVASKGLVDQAFALIVWLAAYLGAVIFHAVSASIRPPK